MRNTRRRARVGRAVRTRAASGTVRWVLVDKAVGFAADGLAVLDELELVRAFGVEVNSAARSGTVLVVYDLYRNAKRKVEYEISKA
jgi:hypothetical protein